MKTEPQILIIKLESYLRLGSGNALEVDWLLANKGRIEGSFPLPLMFVLWS